MVGRSDGSGVPGFGLGEQGPGLLADEAVDIEAPAGQLAYRLVEAMVLDPSDRQRVLDGGDPATRLRTVLALLRRERAIVGRFGAVPTPPMPLGPSLN